jgi:hypothetical protein
MSQPIPWAVPGASPAPPKAKYENKPMPPPGVGYVGAVIAQGVTHKPGKTPMFWVKVQVRNGNDVYEAFIDIHDTERSRDLYLPTWCHAFGILEPVTQEDKQGCGDHLFGNQIRHKGATVCFDIEASNQPKADGTPYYKAANPRRIGEQPREKRQVAPQTTPTIQQAPVGSPATPMPPATIQAPPVWPGANGLPVEPLAPATPPPAVKGNWFAQGAK